MPWFLAAAYIVGRCVDEYYRAADKHERGIGEKPIWPAAIFMGFFRSFICFLGGAAILAAVCLVVVLPLSVLYAKLFAR